MKMFRSPAEMTAWSNGILKAGKTISFVPTMGCFHQGHLRLMKAARGYADHVVVSLFVNPTQFGPNEDYTKYPRVFEQDSVLAKEAKVDVLFAPEAHDLYPEGFFTTISVRQLSEGLCGASRPGHFDGVTTIVGKLFHMVKPTNAVFGSKDFQQLAVIRKMVEDLNWDVEIIAHPIVREKDGLAMSSRNTYLSKSDRESALALSRTLFYLKEKAAAGESNVKELIAAGYQRLSRNPDLIVDYLTIVDETTLIPQETINRQSVLLMAIKVGETRLIDNGHLL